MGGAQVAGAWPVGVCEWWATVGVAAVQVGVHPISKHHTISQVPTTVGAQLPRLSGRGLRKVGGDFSRAASCRAAAVQREEGATEWLLVDGRRVPAGVEEVVRAASLRLQERGLQDLKHSVLLLQAGLQGSDPGQGRAGHSTLLTSCSRHAGFQCMATHTTWEDVHITGVRSLPHTAVRHF